MHLVIQKYQTIIILWVSESVSKRDLAILAAGIINLAKKDARKLIVNVISEKNEIFKEAGKKFNEIRTLLKLFEQADDETVESKKPNNQRFFLVSTSIPKSDFKDLKTLLGTIEDEEGIAIVNLAGREYEAKRLELSIQQVKSEILQTIQDQLGNIITIENKEEINETEINHQFQLKYQEVVALENIYDRVYKKIKLLLDNRKLDLKAKSENAPHIKILIPNKEKLESMLEAQVK